jgi:hypothetical protein
MANVQGKFYTAETQRRGVTPSSPPNAVDEPVNPVNPPGSTPSHSPVTIGTPANGLSLVGQEISLGIGAGLGIDGSGNLEATGGGGWTTGRTLLTGFPVIKFDADYYYPHEMAGAIEISVDLTLARTFPKNTILYIKANGTNKPTFNTSDNFSILYDGWNNTNGEWNRIRLEWSPQGNPVVQIMDTSGVANPGTGATDFDLLFDADYSFSHVIAGTVSLSVDATGAVSPRQTIFYFMADEVNKPSQSGR